MSARALEPHRHMGARSAAWWRTRRTGSAAWCATTSGATGSSTSRASCSIRASRPSVRPAIHHTHKHTHTHNKSFSRCSFVGNSLWGAVLDSDVALVKLSRAAPHIARHIETLALPASGVQWPSERDECHVIGCGCTHDGAFVVPAARPGSERRSSTSVASSDRPFRPILCSSNDFLAERKGGRRKRIRSGMISD